MRIFSRRAFALGFSSLIALLTIAGPLSTNQDAVAKGQIQNHATAEIFDETIGNKSFTVSRIHVKARPEQVWQILTDYNNAPAIFSNLKKCHVVEDKGSIKIVAHEVRPSGIPGSFSYVVEVRESAPKMLEWHRLRGDFRAVDGYWKLEALEGGRATMVTYSAHVNGGVFIPQALIKRQFRLDMPEVMAALKHHAESDTQIARRPGGSASN